MGPHRISGWISSDRRLLILGKWLPLSGDSRRPQPERENGQHQKHHSAEEVELRVVLGDRVGEETHPQRYGQQDDRQPEREQQRQRQQAPPPVLDGRREIRREEEDDAAGAEQRDGAGEEKELTI